MCRMTWLKQGGGLMIKIAVCDDNRYSIDDVLQHLKTYAENTGINYSASSFSSGEQLLSAGKRYDLIFMDYQFGENEDNGITVSEKLKKISPKTAIVFLSGYSDVVFDTFKVGAFRFLLKPIDQGKINEMMDSFILSLGNEQMVRLHTDGKNQMIAERSIIYIESKSRDILVYSTEAREPMYCHENLTSIESRLKGKNFFRCQRSFLINFYHISSYKYANVTMDNGDIIEISRKKYRDFLNGYSDYIDAE